MRHSKHLNKGAYYVHRRQHKKVGINNLMNDDHSAIRLMKTGNMGVVHSKQNKSGYLSARIPGGKIMESCMMTVPQTAEYMNIPVSKVYELVRSKNFPAVKLGKNWRIMKDQLTLWLLNEINKK